MRADAASALDQRFALDVQGVDALRRTVRSSPEEGLRQVSRQFEAVFMQMVLRSMREATPADGGVFGSQQERLYTSMLDQQLAQGLSGRGVGLAEAMLAQLARSTAAPAAGPAAAPAAAAPEPHAVSRPDAAQPLAVPRDLRQAPEAPPAPATGAGGAVPAHVEQFVARMLPAAQAASRASGVPARLILAQAALESGWGRREIRAGDGSPSFNVFGIKADRRWAGRVVEAATTEYVDGAAQPTHAAFRAYGSYEEAFADYAKFLQANPRYAAVRAGGDPAQAAQALQRAGYATDPDYAAKLVRIMDRFA
ncbi:flagellar assembly peptidoglycan hydrolase FlgJ [Ramlibacter tataouinensis]|uniref:flagellar assembly peptidoglycan hydrolase FlgJ n=1 Tax=Ramlibacter tataouinensis TaxID=94132 RepID=UPI0022F3EAEA|nr:flagellar assembly peptidoglycan hydrolase FlgJ [Ramlibacter tataouinensis]WBY00598.1 flagellar assembly peptidoglycan hydrolase FlgJ [Ramlibacter tataouinensis]